MSNMAKKYSDMGWCRVEFRRQPRGGYRVAITDKELSVETVLQYPHEIDGNHGQLWCPQKDIKKVTGMSA